MTPGHTLSAFAELRAAARVRPRGPAALGRLGRALMERVEPARSVPFLRAAARLQPGCAQRLRDLGTALVALGQEDEAARCFERALELEPGGCETYQVLGDLYLDRLGHPADALRIFERAIAAAPPDRSAFRNIARCRLQLGTAPASGDGSPLEVRRGVAEALASYGRYHEAIPLFEAIVRQAPDDAVSLAALGRIWSALRDRPAANRCFEAALAIPGGDVPLCLAYVIHLFKIGEPEKGRQIFRSRLDATALWPGVDGVTPHWMGQDVRGKTLLLDIGAYFGDGLQFVRFAKFAKQAGATVVVRCPRALGSLVRTVPGVDRAVAAYGAVGRFDFQACAFWLLMGLDVPVDEMMGGEPYLDAPAALRGEWRAKVPRGFAVGIAWRGSNGWYGNPYAWRSMPLEQLRPLSRVPGITLYSLQKGKGREELTRGPAPFPAVDLAPDFVNTAAAIKALDVVVTIDTSIAHLAGALGKTTFVMLPYEACFRWLTDRDDSPWYRSVRLFRQSKPGDWTDVVARVASALEDWRGRAAGGGA